MNFLKNIGKAIGEAASFVGEKSRKAAMLSRIRTVISCEEKAAQKEYVALGRYYYNNLRDPANTVTEPHCAELEAIEARLDKALSALELFYQQDGPSAAVIGDKEEVTLEDVKCFESDPIPEEKLTETPEPACETVAEPVSQGAAPEENDELPFEG